MMWVDVLRVGLPPIPKRYWDNSQADWWDYVKTSATPFGIHMVTDALLPCLYTQTPLQQRAPAAAVNTSNRYLTSNDHVSR